MIEINRLRSLSSPSQPGGQPGVRRAPQAVNMQHTIRRAVSLLVLLTSASQAQEPDINVMSFEDASCGAWVISASNEAVRAQYVYWIRGFVSGYNSANRKNQVRIERMPNNATLQLYVDKYCHDNPLQPFTFSAFQLINELKEHPDARSTR